MTVGKKKPQSDTFKLTESDSTRPKKHSSYMSEYYKNYIRGFKIILTARN